MVRVRSNVTAPWCARNPPQLRRISRTRARRVRVPIGMHGEKLYRSENKCPNFGRGKAIVFSAEKITVKRTFFRGFAIPGSTGAGWKPLGLQKSLRKRLDRLKSEFRFRKSGG